MPDCSKGLKSSDPGHGSGSRGKRDRCRNCQMLEAKIHDVKQTIGEMEKEYRKKVRELRNKRKKMKKNLILLTVIYISNPAILRENVVLADTIASLVGGYRDEMGESDIQDEDEE